MKIYLRMVCLYIVSIICRDHPKSFIDFSISKLGFEGRLYKMDLSYFKHYRRFPLSKCYFLDHHKICTAYKACLRILFLQRFVTSLYFYSL